MELKIILLLANIYLFLKAIASVQRSLYFDRLGREGKGQRLDWSPKNIQTKEVFLYAKSN